MHLKLGLRENYERKLNYSQFYRDIILEHELFLDFYCRYLLANISNL